MRNENCLDALAGIPSESVDCVVTDCPYRIIAGGIRLVEQKDEPRGVLGKRDYSKTDPRGVLGRGRRVVSDGSECSDKWLKVGGNTPSAVKDGKMFEHNEIKFSEWLPGIFRVLKKGTHCYIMINARNLKELQVEAERVGFVFQNLLVWNKCNQTPNKFYMQQLEFILMLSKRPARNINDMGSSTLITIQNIRDKQHPTEKPASLMRLLIENSTERGDMVLDPFAGTGATGVACIEAGRRAIIIEIDEEYHRIAKSRCSLANPLPTYAQAALEM